MRVHGANNKGLWGLTSTSLFKNIKSQDDANPDVLDDTYRVRNSFCSYIKPAPSLEQPQPDR
jgi:hypothetical protein